MGGNQSTIKDMAQLMGSLPIMYRAASSNPSTATHGAKAEDETSQVQNEMVPRAIFVAQVLQSVTLPPARS